MLTVFGPSGPGTDASSPLRISTRHNNQAPFSWPGSGGVALLRPPHADIIWKTQSSHRTAHALLAATSSRSRSSSAGHFCDDMFASILHGPGQNLAQITAPFLACSRTGARSFALKCTLHGIRGTDSSEWGLRGCVVFTRLDRQILPKKRDAATSILRQGTHRLPWEARLCERDEDRDARRAGRIYIYYLHVTAI